MKGLKGNFGEIGESLKLQGWDYIKFSGKRLFSDMGKNLKTEFWNFGAGDAEACKSIKNLVTVPKDLLEGENPLKVGLLNVVCPAVTTFSVDTGIGVENITVADLIEPFLDSGSLIENLRAAY